MNYQKTFFVIVFLALVVGSGQFIYGRFKAGIQCNMLFGLRDLVLGYAEAHGSTMPANWKDLEDWDKIQGKHFLKNAESLEQATELAWGRNLRSINRAILVIRVHDAHMKSCENEVNQVFWNLYSPLEQTRRAN